MKRRELLATLPVAISGCAGMTDAGQTEGRDGYRVDVTSEQGTEDYSVGFDVTYPEAEVVVADIYIEIKADSAEEVTITAGPPGPFGVIAVEAVDNDRSMTLWSDKYEESDMIETEDHRITRRNQPQVMTELSPSQSVVAAYSVRKDTTRKGSEVDFKPGTYETTGEDSETFEVNNEPLNFQLEIIES